MRSQIILALLATAISAAPVLNTGDAKVCSLSQLATTRTDRCHLLTHPSQNSQLSKREAEPGLAVIGGVVGEDASVRTTPILVESYRLVTVLTLPQDSQLVKREAEPGLDIGLLGEDASVRATVLSIDLDACTNTSNRTRLFRSALPAQPHLSASLQTEHLDSLYRVTTANLSVSDCTEHIHSGHVIALAPVDV